MSKRILVIDDESGFCDILKDMLSDDGYVVETPRHLASAVGTALQGNHDLIILDLRMPGIDGLEIARLFKRQKLSTPIMVISGYLTETVPQHLQELGIRYTLSKPTGVVQLRGAVARAIA